MSEVAASGSGSGPAFLPESRARAEPSSLDRAHLERAPLAGSPPETASGILEIRDLGRSFGDRAVLRDVSFEVAAGEIVALVGPSGSGKSTLLSLLTGALTPEAGEIRYDGRAVASAGSSASSGVPVVEARDNRGAGIRSIRGPRPFAFMPQRDVLLPWRRIVDNAGIGLEVAGVRRAEARRRVVELLEPFGLAGTERLYPRQLSGGMRQRVSFLRTVVQQRPVLLLDEPLGALDAITRDELQRWLLEMWAEHGWSMLLITHDIREAVRLADRVLVLPSTAGPLAGEVRVSRDIDRGDEFLTDPRVPQLEAELHELLRAAAR